MQVERHFVRVVAVTNKAASSWNKYRQKVGHFLDYCKRHSWIAGDLLGDVRERTVPQVERMQLSPLEMVTVLDDLTDPRDRGYIALASNTGLRRGEIGALKVQDVDLDLNELYCYRSKSYQDDRLGLTPMLATELRRWLRSYAQELQELGGWVRGRQSGPIELQADMRLFPQRSLSHAQAVARNVYVPRAPGRLQPFNELKHPERIVHRALDQLGIMEQRGQGVHLFRRSAARAFFESLADKGYDQALRTVMTMLGHKNAHTTELYLGISGDRRRRNTILKAQNFLPYENAKVIALRAVE
jgi:integrase